MRRWLGLVVIAVVLPAWAAGGASACGHCVEDKVAAVYDYGAIAAASARGDAPLYLAIAGGASLTAETRAARVRAALVADAGVSRGSVRVSAEPAAAFCACRGGGKSARGVVERANRRLGAIGVRLTPLTPPAETAVRR